MLSSTALRFIAAITMLIDHFAYVFIDSASPWYIPLRTIGRLAFPIFCFLIVEGFEHTSSLKNYLKRLVIFALISEIPFDLAFRGELLEFGHQNVYLTLISGLVCIAFARYISPRLMELVKVNAEGRENRFNQLLVASPVIFLLCKMCDYLGTDYGHYGVLLICAFYLARKCRPAAIVMLAALTVYRVLDINMLDNTPATMVQFSGYILKPEYNPQLYACLAAVPIAMYSGKPGKRLPKYAFYIFYPAHLLALVLIRAAVM